MHTAKLFAFPAASIPPMGPPPVASAPPVRRTSEMDLFAVAALFGLSNRPLRTIISTIRVMQDRRGFPAPKNPRIVNGEPASGSRAVHRFSVWRRDDVERWYDDDQPPPVAAARAERRRELTRDVLAAAAQALVA